MMGNRFKELSIKLECVAITAALVFGTTALSGCQKFYRTNPTEHTHETAAEYIKPGTPTEASPTPSPTPTPDPKKEAMKIAEYVGLTEEDLRGKYELFEKYSAAVCGNLNL